MSPLRSSAFSCTAAACLIAAAGCGAEPTEVGEAVLRLDLSRCYGARCEPLSVPPRAIEAPERASCAIDVAPPLKPAWTAPLVGPAAVAVGADEALWVASSVDRRIVLQRFDPTGVVLTDMELDWGDADTDAGMASGNIWISLAVSPLGQAFIGLHDVATDFERGFVDAPQNVVLHVSDQGELLAEPIAVQGLRGVMQLGAGADGSLLIAGQNSEGFAVLARLDQGGTLRWVQTAPVHAEAAALVGDRDGQVLVIGNAPAILPLTFDESVAAYDAHGNVLWDVHPNAEARPRPWTYGQRIARYATGGWFVAVRPVNKGGRVLAFKLDGRGRTVWSRLVSGVPFQEGTSVDGEGDAYFGLSGLGVLRFDRDGRCIERLIAQEDETLVVSVRAMYVSPGGAKYFSTGASIGAFEP